MKYIDADKLKAEIERLYEEHISREYRDEAALVLEKLEDFLDSLPEQPVEGLEEAAKEYTDGKSWAKENYLTPYIREAFKAGAEWQKAKMLEDAEECDLYYDGDFLAIDLNMEALGYCERDKVRVIVIKEDKL